MTKLETFVAATAVVILGLVTSLNALDQNTLNTITSHPIYRQVTGFVSGTDSVTQTDAPKPSSQPDAPARAAKQGAQQSVTEAVGAKIGAVKNIDWAGYWQKAQTAASTIKGNALRWYQAVDFDALKGRAERLVGKVKGLFASKKPAAASDKKSEEEQG